MFLAFAKFTYRSCFSFRSSSRVFLFFPSPLNFCCFCRHCRLVGSSGVEPPTSCLSGMRSNLLSYEPLLLAQPRSTFDLRFKSYEPLRFFNRWWRWRDSNPWPPACRAGALPTELHPHIWGFQQSLEIEQQLFEDRIVSTSSFLFLCELRRFLFQILMFSIERRWSSRTFRYGYLVTT